MTISILIPIKLESINKKFHWAKKYAYTQRQSKAILLFLNSAPVPKLPCKITITRGGVRAFDEDNFIASAKHIRDTIADWIIPGLAPGQADGNKNLTWKYEQTYAKTGEDFIQIDLQEM